MIARSGYNFWIYFTRILYEEKIDFDDYIVYGNKDSAIRTIAFYLTCKDIKNVRVEYKLGNL